MQTRHDLTGWVKWILCAALAGSGASTLAAAEGNGVLTHLNLLAWHNCRWLPVRAIGLQQHQPAHVIHSDEPGSTTLAG